MPTHTALHPPLPPLSRAQTPTTLNQLTHFIQTTYTQTRHPDKFEGWLKGLLDGVLDLSEVGDGVGDVGVEGEQGQGQGQTSTSSSTSNNLPQTPAQSTTQTHQSSSTSSNQNQNQNQPQQTQQPQPKPYKLSTDQFNYLMAYHASWPGSQGGGGSGAGSGPGDMGGSGARGGSGGREFDGENGENGGRGSTRVNEVDGGIGLILLYILAKHLQSPLTPETHPISLVLLAERLIDLLDPRQLGSCSEALCLIVRGMKGMGKLHRLQDSGLGLMNDMIRLIAHQSPGSLSGGHAAFVETAYVSGRSDVALPILNVPIEDVSYFKLRPTDFLYYHFYGAMIHLDRRDWEQAREYLELTVTTPADIASPVQIEAHCKLVLVNLIIEGKPFSYPAYLSPAVNKAIREQGKAYEPIVEGFAQRNPAVVWTINKDEFVKDHNVPLIEEVQQAFLDWQVRDMTKIYSKMFLDDVAQRLFAKDGQGRISERQVEDIIDHLVGRGKLHAQITSDQAQQPRAFVTFFDNPEEYRSKETVTKLNDLIKKSRDTAVLALERDRKMGLHDEWLGRVIKKNEDMSILTGGMSDAGKTTNKAPGVLKGVGSNWNDVGF